MAWGVQNLISTQGLEAARPLFSKLFGLLQGIGPRDITCLGVRKDTSHTAVRNRMGAAAAPPPVPKTPESIRLDEVLRLADLRAQQLGYLAQ